MNKYGNKLINFISYEDRFPLFQGQTFMLKQVKIFDKYIYNMASLYRMYLYNLNPPINVNMHTMSNQAVYKHFILYL